MMNSFSSYEVVWPSVGLARRALEDRGSQPTVFFAAASSSTSRDGRSASLRYALEYGALGIRANVVNADRVRTAIYGDGVLEQRAAARGQSVDEYLSGGNLLGREVTTDDVARAFVDLALARKTTGAVLTVDGGNIAAALR